MKRAPSKPSQQGAVIVTVAMMLLFLLGFTGIALDFGRLFIVKTELQTAMDSCALAAAQELDGSSSAITRATAAGRTAGNLNNFNFQTSPVGLVDADVQFNDTLDGVYDRVISPANARYVQCRQLKSGIAPWLLKAFTAFSGESGYAASKGVEAAGTATLASAQTNCLMPVAMCKRPTSERTSAAPWGYVRGDWVEGVTNDTKNSEISELSGQFKWIDLGDNDAGGTRGIKDLLAGTDQCNLPGTSTLISEASGKPGKSNGAVAAWNTRFGIYTASYDAATNVPDLTGYAWYHDGDRSTLPADKRGRYDDTSSHGFAYQRANNTAFQSDAKDYDQGGLAVKEGSKKASPTVHANGANRRIITIGVVEDCSAAIKLVDFACMLMLHPLPTNANGKQPKMWLEFIGDASSPTNNPCATIGLPGGSGSLRVPTLVR